MWLLLHTPVWMPSTLILLVGFVAYPIISFWLVSCSKEHEWMSSFIEVSIALNSAMLVTDLREWFVDRFKTYSKVFVGVAISRMSFSRNDIQLARLSKKIYKTEKPLSSRLRNIARWFAFIGFIAIVIACAVLLTDCNKSNMRFIPLLAWPFVLFYLLLFLQFLFALNCSRQICREFSTGTRPEPTRKEFSSQIEKINKIVPIAESED